MGNCTIVMYHYVRDVEGRRFPDINARSVDEFESQLDYLEAEYTVIGYERLRAAVRGEATLPEAAVVLTFDDGLRDHFETVYPILRRRNLPGLFFPPSVPIRDERMLDVHKLHVIFSECDDTGRLLARVKELLERNRQRFGLEDPATYYDRLAERGRWDPPEIVYVKRLLQRELPEEARRHMTNELFETYVTSHEQALAREWYMTEKELHLMIEGGMYVGSHSANHYWLDNLERNRLEAELEASLSFLADLGAPTEDWLFSYPYGAYNETTLKSLEAHGCLAGVTTDPGVADLVSDDPLTLPRLDTNDLPTSPA